MKRMDVLDIDAACEFLRERHGIVVSPAQLSRLLQPWVLPAFWSRGTRQILADDVSSAADFIAYSCRQPIGELFSGLEDDSFYSRCVRVDIGADRNQLPTVFFAACSNVLREACATTSAPPDFAESHTYFGPSRIATSESTLADVVAKQRKRYEELMSSSASQFANSAYYMGSKKVLAPFLVEALSAVTNRSTQIVDLMCGSGAAAGAFARFWPTVASDAQRFCRSLAVVQGGGYNRARAAQVVDLIRGAAGEHVNSLLELTGDIVEREELILHGEFGEETVTAYRDFVSSVPLYPEIGSVGAWNPTLFVTQRQENAKISPYCLCTAYFANVYFGFRQSLEIDSIRFAIDQLNDPLDRKWALGALVTTMSAVALTYGGHFAQPLIRSVESITSSNLTRILERRAMSVMHEFSVRFLNLAEESERARYPVKTISGPWRAALEMVNYSSHNRTIIYLDAPYKREEYSRYYHVLETLCMNSYPSSSGPARMPRKQSGERFQSEFFTRSSTKIVDAFVAVIGAVLERGCICAWSYSDNGAVSPLLVFDAVRKKHAIQLRSFATPFVHKAQGGSSKKEITEYLVLFMPVD